MYITTSGLVLRETEYKESSKMLTVLTGDKGRLSVIAKGARRRGSKSAAGTQFLTYSEMTLYAGKAGWTLTETRSIEHFQGLRDHLEKLSLASYFAELLEVLSNEDVPDPELLRLGLNGIYAVSADYADMRLIKAAFEMRIMEVSGYGPETGFCPVCGKTDIDEPYLSMAGAVCCKGCTEGAPTARLDSGSLSALRYILSADLKRLFSFELSESGLGLLSEACEKYALYQLDRGFKTLDFYKSITSQR